MGQKSGDSLGNPNTPGYEPWGKKKTGDATAQAAEETKEPGGTVIQTKTQGPELIRLTVGWDRILLAQKKLCEKAKGLFTLLEGPETYVSQKKTRRLKARGCMSHAGRRPSLDYAQRYEPSPQCARQF